MLTKRLFLTQQNFIDALFTMEPEGNLTDYFGLYFRGLDEITGNEDDDSDFAGPNFYVLNTESSNFIENFPKQFPCIISICEYARYYNAVAVYPSDFKIV